MMDASPSELSVRRGRHVVSLRRIDPVVFQVPSFFAVELDGARVIYTESPEEARRIFLRMVRQCSAVGVEVPA